MTYEEALRNSIFRFVSGSHAYGTNRPPCGDDPGSDEDIRGVFIAPLHCCFDLFQSSFVGGGSPGQRLKGALDDIEDGNYVGAAEQIRQAMDPEIGDLSISVGTVHKPGVDEEMHELRKFLKLASDCNPNIVEAFGVERLIIHQTPIWEKISKQKHMFLSKKCRWTFSGYAIAQAKRIEVHRGYLLNPPTHKPTREEFGLPCETTIAKENQNAILSLPIQWISDSAREIVVREKQYGTALAEWNAYKKWERERNPARKELERKYGFDCYADDTEFLTDKGWKFYGEVQSGDKLATVFIRPHDSNMSHRRHLGVEYQEPIDRFKGKYSGPMYSLSGTHLDVRVTPNHRILYRKVERASQKVYGLELNEAALLPDTFEVLVAPEPSEKAYCNARVFGDIPISQRGYMTLMGWYLSEGSVSRDRGRLKSIRICQKLGGRISWSMARWNADYGKAANSSLYDYPRSEKNLTERILDVRNKLIVNKMASECGWVKKKRIPRWVFSLGKPLMERLFDSMVGGDGTERNHKTRPDSIIYYSSVKDLADDVQELAMMCGWETALWGPYLSETEYGTVEMYQVHVRKETPRFRRLVRFQNVKKEYVEDQGIVCFTVPNGTLITRRNGKVAIHGNSKHAMHLVRLVRMGKELLRDGVLNVYRPDREELKSILHGGWKYEDIVRVTATMDSEMDELYKTSPLPDRPDHKGISNLYKEICEEHYKIRVGS